MRDIRVLMVVPNLRVANGVASFAMNYFRSIDRNRIHMDFAIYKDIESPYVKEIKAYGGRVFCLPPLRKMQMHVKECKKILKSGNYHVIHDNTLLVSYPMMLLAKVYHVPVRILHSHNSKLGETKCKELRNRLFLPFLRGTATDYAACSTLAGQAMFGKKTCYFIPNVVSASLFLYSEEKREKVRAKIQAGEKIVIGTVGRVCEQKNPMFALEIISCLIKRNPEIEYWWIGSGAMDEKFKERIVEMGLQDYVRVFGSREDVPDLYQAMDVILMPSLFEGLGITLIEAQSMGLPCVISDTIPEEVRYTDLIQSVSLDDPVVQWVKAIEEQLAVISKRRSYIPELKESVFSSENAGARMESMYMEMLAEARQRRK